VTRSRSVRLRDVATGRTRILLRGRGAYCAALAPDGGFLATGDDDAVVRVWDLAQPHRGASKPRTGDPTLATRSR
jgi:WD40 repeat protein